jgi:hypothetical protein
MPNGRIQLIYPLKISYLYLEPLLAGDPLRPVEVDAIIHEEDEADGQRTTTSFQNARHPANDKGIDGQ